MRCILLGNGCCELCGLYSMFWSITHTYCCILVGCAYINMLDAHQFVALPTLVIRGWEAITWSWSLYCVSNIYKLLKPMRITWIQTLFYHQQNTYCERALYILVRRISTKQLLINERKKLFADLIMLGYAVTNTHTLFAVVVSFDGYQHRELSMFVVCASLHCYRHLLRG